MQEMPATHWVMVDNYTPRKMDGNDTPWKTTEAELETEANAVETVVSGQSGISQGKAPAKITLDKVMRILLMKH